MDQGGPPLSSPSSPSKIDLGYCNYRENTGETHQLLTMNKFLVVLFRPPSSLSPIRECAQESPRRGSNNDMAISGVSNLINLIVRSMGMDRRREIFSSPAPAHIVEATDGQGSKLRERCRAEIQISLLTALASIGDGGGHALPLV